jgi:hypothetical protein
MNELNASFKRVSKVRAAYLIAVVESAVPAA